MFGLDSCQAMLPAINMYESLNFYEDLGFRIRTLDETVAELTWGTTSFYLKSIPKMTLVGAPVMIVTVFSIQDWWLKVRLLDIGSRHSVKPPCEPRYEPWGQTVGYIYDPSGTTWQFSEAVDSANVFERATNIVAVETLNQAL